MGRRAGFPVVNGVDQSESEYAAEQGAHLCVPLLGRLLDRNPEKSDDEKSRTAQDPGK